MRSGLHFDHGRHAILFNMGHDSFEPVPRGLRDDRPLSGLPSLVLEAADIGLGHEPLPTRGSPHP